jgi:ribonuclease HII
LKTFIAGIDDAGRGPVIGPLVIAGVLVNEEKLKLLSEIGVKDSKLLTPNQRTILANKIQRISLKYCYEEISPKEIDEVVFKSKKLFKLNYLEAQAMAKIIEKLRPQVAYVDASDVLEDRFGRQIENMLPFKVKIISKHKADTKFPVVSAASILAKVYRDDAISKLSKVYGDIGSGYPGDSQTRKFLQKWIMKHEDFPDFVRKSWKTVQKIKSEIRKERKLI